MAAAYALLHSLLIREIARIARIARLLRTGIPWGNGDRNENIHRLSTY
jgi:hypothetical protein